MTPEERNELVSRLYYQELGKINPKQGDIDYWAGTGLDEAGLRWNLRNAAGLDPTSVVRPLLADNSYAAFLRGMQFDESQIQSSLQSAQEAAQRRIQGQAGSYDLQRKQSGQNVDRDFEGRGMFRSGGRIKKAAEGRMTIDRNQRQFEDQIGESSAKMERDAAGQIGRMRRERAEREAETRDRLTRRSAVYPNA